MSVAEKGLGMPDGIRKIVRDVGLFDWYRMKVCARMRCHLAGDVAFVIGGLVEGERECLDRRTGQPRRKSQHRAGIKSAAEITTYWNVGAHPQPHRFLKNSGEFVDIG